MKYLTKRPIFNVPSPLLSLVKDELFTEKEVQKYKLNREYLKLQCQRKMYISFFGARFEGRYNMTIYMETNEKTDSEWVVLSLENGWYFVKHYVDSLPERKVRCDDFFTAVEYVKEWKGSYFALN